jgi:hypothetical protein
MSKHKKIFTSKEKILLIAMLLPMGISTADLTIMNLSFSQISTFTWTKKFKILVFFFTN